jgi:hypothetical protein
MKLFLKSFPSANSVAGWYFSYQNSRFGYILKGLRLENVGMYIFWSEYFAAVIFYGHIFARFVLFCGHLVYVFLYILVCFTEKNLATLDQMKRFYFQRLLSTDSCVVQ